MLETLSSPNLSGSRRETRRPPICTFVKFLSPFVFFPPSSCQVPLHDFQKSPGRIFGPLSDLPHSGYILTNVFPSLFHSALTSWFYHRPSSAKARFIQRCGGAMELKNPPFHFFSSDTPFILNGRLVLTMVGLVLHRLLLFFPFFHLNRPPSLR